MQTVALRALFVGCFFVYTNNCNFTVEAFSTAGTIYGSTRTRTHPILFYSAPTKAKDRGDATRTLTRKTLAMEAFPTTLSGNNSTFGVVVGDRTIKNNNNNNSHTKNDSVWIWQGAVVGLCALWASNFPVTKLVLAEPGVESSVYGVARFAVAVLALAPFALQKEIKNAATEATTIAPTTSNGMDWETLQGALECGSWVAFGYIGQLLGLLTTTASKSCVICSLHCVFVAIVAEWTRAALAKENVESLSSMPTTNTQPLMTAADTTATATTTATTSSRETTPVDTDTDFDIKRLLPAAVAVAGVAIVELQGAAGAPTIGDALSFCQPIGFGMGYLKLEELMAKKPETALAVSAIKLAVVAAASLAVFEVGPLLSQLSSGGGGDVLALRMPDFGAILASPIATAGVLYTGLVTTALALWVESIAFCRVPATDASIILTTEPLFAAGLGAMALGETFGLSDFVGAGLIVAACVLAVLLGEEEKSIDSAEPSSNSNQTWPWPLQGFINAFPLRGS